MKAGHTIGRAGLYAFLVTTALFFAIPLVIMLLTALKDSDEARGASIFLLPQSPDFEAFATAWSSACIGRDCNGIGGRFWRRPSRSSSPRSTASPSPSGG